MRVVTSKERQEIGEFLDRIRDTARRNFENDAVCVPVAVFLLAEGDAALPLQPLLKDKAVASAVINHVIDQSRPLAFALVTEAWMASAGDQPRDAAGKSPDLLEKFGGGLTDGDARPKEGVKEVVMLQCSAVTGENFLLSADIVRPEGAQPALKPWVRTESAGGRGRFIFDVTPLVERQ